MALATAAAWATFGIAVLGGFVALVFGVIVFVVRSDSRMNRRLAALLLVDGFFSLSLGMYSWFGWEGTIRGNTVLTWILAVDGLAQLLFAMALESRIARAMRHPAGVAVILLAFLATTVPATVLALAAPEGTSPEDFVYGAGWMFWGLAGLWAFVAVVSAVSAAQKGTVARRRARIFAWGFGGSALITFLSVAGWLIVASLGRPDLAEWFSVPAACRTIVLVSLLMYGILAYQLFDIELKIKLGISRGTVVALGIIGVLVAAKVAEFYLSHAVGYVAGGVVAGSLLFLAPRLNKLGDKVANAALPQVQPTPAYLSFKKLEVYRAAVESAMESDHRIGEAGRAMLDRLQAKLGLAAEDCRAVEAEVPGAGGPFTAPAAPA